MRTELITKVWGHETAAHAPIMDEVQAWCTRAGQPVQVALFEPVPIDARPCQRPGLVRAEVLIGNRAYAVTFHNNKLTSNLP
jgi:hypothetical protein